VQREGRIAALDPALSHLTENAALRLDLYKLCAES
jgi:hypothetical protein